MILQLRRARAQPAERAVNEVLDQDVDAGDYLLEQLAPFLGLHVERDRLLVGVEHGERQRRTADDLRRGLGFLLSSNASQFDAAGTFAAVGGLAAITFIIV